MSHIFEELTSEEQIKDISNRIKDLEQDIIELEKLPKIEYQKLNSKEKKDVWIKISFIVIKYNRISDLINLSKINDCEKAKLQDTLIQATNKGKTRK